MKIAVYMICKNERDFIVRAIESAKDADEIIVLDTGSTDGTYEILEKLDVKLYRGWFSPFRFDDARNHALAKVSPDVDLCVSLDADEVLMPGWRDHLTEIGRYDHRFRTVWDWRGEGKNVSEHLHERVHPRKGYRWKLPVHEVLESESGEEKRLFCEMMIEQRPDRTKSRPYLPMLERSLQERQNNWKLWYFYAEELIDAGRILEATQAISRGRNLQDPDPRSEGCFNHLEQRCHLVQQAGSVT